MIPYPMKFAKKSVGSNKISKNEGQFEKSPTAIDVYIFSKIKNRVKILIE